MKSFSCSKPKENVGVALDDVLAIDPSVVFLFAAPSFFRDAKLVSEVKTRLADVPFIGCSTSGEISNDGVLKESVSFMAIHFDKTSVRTACTPSAKREDCYAAGKKLAESLKAPGLSAVFVLGPGTNVNGSGLVDGVVDCLGRDIVVSGGLAGDETDFNQTYTFCSSDVFSDHAIAVGLYGDAVRVSCGSEGGWRPFGAVRRVTKSEANVLYEIDGKPALQLYKQYLGEKARELPASGLSYPFAILRDDRTTSGIIRSALDIDHEKESIILAGDIPEGCQVCLMHADTAALTQGAAQAAAEALRTHNGPEENGCALVVSCIGRKIVYGIDAEEEVETVMDSFLPSTPIAGFYAYGEICSYPGTGRAELHNQNMAITYITEYEGD